MEKIIGIFDKYFVILVLIEGFITIFIDAPSFKKSNMIKSYKQARYMGIFIVIVSLILYILQMTLF
ncbi:CLC_0170 family protein [Clostridium sp. Marseille-Q2269]|uniref:CLC_0170 family protein n=1 Tax=Clostridium sp. Marseille-Q2269 TaxID=2942205 RepID=UPI0020730EF5|nr:CLC_0170 family protein [Clostridium sp. Marseille-Q2269]